jgi:hypothetical protein
MTRHKAGRGFSKSYKTCLNILSNFLTHLLHVERKRNLEMNLQRARGIKKERQIKVRKAIYYLHLHVC